MNIFKDYAMLISDSGQIRHLVISKRRISLVILLRLEITLIPREKIACENLL